MFGNEQNEVEKYLIKEGYENDIIQKSKLEKENKKYKLQSV